MWDLSKPLTRQAVPSCALPFLRCSVLRPPWEDGSGSASPRPQARCRRERLSLQRFRLPRGLMGCPLLLPSTGMGNGWMTWPPGRYPKGRAAPPAPGKGGGGCCPWLSPGRRAGSLGTGRQLKLKPPRSLHGDTHRPPRDKETSSQEERPAGTWELWLRLPGAQGWPCPQTQRSGAAAIGASAGTSLVSRRAVHGFPGKVPLRTARGRSARSCWSLLGIWAGLLARKASRRVSVSWFGLFTLLLPRLHLFAFQKRALVEGQKRGWDWAEDLLVTSPGFWALVEAPRERRLPSRC